MSPHLERLTRFYRKYNADKLHEIDGVLERFKGRETQLFSALVKKYGPEPTEDELLGAATEETEKETPPPAPVDASESDSPKELNYQRLLAFYQKYNPEKVDDVAQVLAKYKGKESKLFDALVKKYGPEPGDSDDEEEDEDKEETHEEEEEDDDEEGEDGEPKLRSVLYCPIDTFPPEYCEYGPMFNECKPWLAENCPDLVLSKYNRTVADLLEVEKQIAAGVEGITLEVEGKTVKKKKKNKIEEAAKRKENCKVVISKSSRKGRKRLTFVTGLEDFEGVNIKDASKSLGKRFACSSSLSKTDQGQQQIQLQGDCVVELLEVLPEMFGIHEDQIVVVEEPIKAAKKPGKSKNMSLSDDEMLDNLADDMLMEMAEEEEISAAPSSVPPSWSHAPVAASNNPMMAPRSGNMPDLGQMMSQMMPMMSQIFGANAGANPMFAGGNNSLQQAPVSWQELVKRHVPNDEQQDWLTTIDADATKLRIASSSQQLNKPHSKSYSTKPSTLPSAFLEADTLLGSMLTEAVRAAQLEQNGRWQELRDDVVPQLNQTGMTKVFENKFKELLCQRVANDPDYLAQKDSERFRNITAALVV
ncbi:hypothetical protein BBJ29_001646 [Phytophthora kernoviae]|uniref:SUI1 domain-containing protein n=1 Tax=Phytophthora kernoviae TaxID=325452 RepID=A0A3F2RRV8_9STRA|nr:hypothetical protein BBP00_00004411 [Phytophthora kernoviae]RLN71095.1 hypothetical protein BBJ29_001646 [Phytophthora kernoviae]